MAAEVDAAENSVTELIALWKLPHHRNDISPRCEVQLPEATVYVSHNLSRICVSLRPVFFSVWLEISDDFEYQNRNPNAKLCCNVSLCAGIASKKWLARIADFNAVATTPELLVAQALKLRCVNEREHVTAFERLQIDATMAGDAWDYTGRVYAS